MKKRVLMIDGYNLFIRCFNVVPITNEDGEHFGAVFGFLRSMKSSIEMFNPTEVVVTWDGPGASIRRRVINEDYKANRVRTFKRGMTRAYDFLSEQDLKENFSYQLNRIKEYLDFFPVKCIMIPFVEADDIISEYCKLFDGEVVIYSTDGDFKQLATDRIIAYNPITKKITNTQTFTEIHGYDPKYYIFLKCITGDKSDNLPGIKGLGEKKFLKLFPEFTTENCPIESIDDLVLRAYELLQKEGNRYTKSQVQLLESIVSSKDLLQNNYNIMQLFDVNISIQAKDAIRSLCEDSANQFNKHRLRTMFFVDKLMGQLKDFDDWSYVFSGLQKYSVLTKGKCDD